MYIDYGGGTIKMDNWVVWLQAKVRECWFVLRPRLNVGPICNGQHRRGGI